MVESEKGVGVALLVVVSEKVQVSVMSVIEPENDARSPRFQW